MADNSAFSTAIDLLRQATDILSRSGTQTRVIPNETAAHLSAPAMGLTANDNPNQVQLQCPESERPRQSSSTLIPSSREKTVLSNFRNLFAPYSKEHVASASTFSSQKASCPLASRRVTRPSPYYKVKEIHLNHHEFICVESPYQTTVPSKSQKLTLQSAGLGKKIVFGNKDSAMKVKEKLEAIYAKLKAGSGYEILRSGTKTII